MKRPIRDVAASVRQRLNNVAEPGELATQVVALRAFLGPVLAALVAGTPFEKRWASGGPWA